MKGVIKATVQNRLTNDISRMDVDADLFGAFAVHKSIGAHGMMWQVSHVESGLAFGATIGTKKLAAKFARLANRHADKFKLDIS